MDELREGAEFVGYITVDVKGEKVKVELDQFLYRMEQADKRLYAVCPSGTVGMLFKEDGLFVVKQPESMPLVEAQCSSEAIQVSRSEISSAEGRNGEKSPPLQIYLRNNL